MVSLTKKFNPAKGLNKLADAGRDAINQATNPIRKVGDAVGSIGKDFDDKLGGVKDNAKKINSKIRSVGDDAKSLAGKGNDFLAEDSTGTGLTNAEVIGLAIVGGSIYAGAGTGVATPAAGTQAGAAYNPAYTQTASVTPLQQQHLATVGGGSGIGTTAGGFSWGSLGWKASTIAGAGVIQANQTYDESKNAQQEYRNEAARLHRQAEMTKKVYARQAAVARREGQRAVGRQTQDIADSGLVLTGSASDVIEQTERLSEQDIQNIMQESADKVNELRTRAGEYEKSANDIDPRENALVSGLTTAGQFSLALL